MLRPEVRHIFRTGRPTNFKLGTQTEHEDPHQRQAQWPPRSKVKIAKSHDASDRCWPISRERNVLETPKLVERLHTPRAIMRSSFKAKDWVRRPVSQTSAVTRPATAVRPKLYHIYWMGRPTNFRIGTLVEHALSTVTPSYKAMKLDSCMRAGAYRVGHTRRPRSLF